MIKGILFVVFFILLAAIIAFTVWMSIRVSKEGQLGDEVDSDLKEAKRKHESKVEDIRWYGKGNKDEITAALSKENQRYSEEIERIKAAAPKVKSSKPGLISSICLSVAMLGLVICIPGSFHQVEAGSVAVVKELGKIVDIRTPGTYFDFYMTKNYEIYDTTVQQVQIKTAAYSHDAQTMDLELYLQYQIQLDKLIVRDTSGNIIQSEGIAGKYVTLSSLQARIETQCIEKTKAVMSAEHFYEPDPITGMYPANDFAMRGEEIIRHRADVSNKVSVVVRDAIGSDYYVTVQDVVLTNIDFTDEFEKSVEDKVIAEQEKQAAITRAEAELEVAKLEAQKKIEQARGDAEAQKIIAKAAAEAATYNLIELSRTIGYTVNENYTYTTTVEIKKSSGYSSITSSEAVYTTKQPESTESVVTIEGTEEDPITVTTTTTIALTSTQYTIDITTGPGADKFKELVEDYLKYLEYLKVWNGELPDVVAGDDAISIIVPNGN